MELDFEKFKNKILERKNTTSKGLHSYTHIVTKEVLDFTGEKNFGLWLGQTKRLGPGQMKAHLAYMKSRGIKSPNYLMSLCRKQHVLPNQSQKIQ